MTPLPTNNEKLNQTTREPKPSWLRVKAPNSKEFHSTRKLIRKHKLNTVCEEAACPNIGQCWSQGHATVMILGSVCTRACTFCNVSTGRPDSINEQEPIELAKMAAKLKLKHMVITSVDRDDLKDGGARQFARCIEQVRKASSITTIEVLTPDFRNKKGALEQVLAAKPDVYNHNLETVPRLYTEVRPGARYYHSIKLLDNAKLQDKSVFTKSGIMVGLGEEKREVLQVMDDLRCANVDFITIGQYLQPTPKHQKVSRFVEPKEFQEYERIAYGKGFLMVSASPLTRSSYLAGDDFVKLQTKRLARVDNEESILGKINETIS